MANQRLLDVPIAGAAMLSVKATVPVRYFEIVEDESVVPQGLIYQCYLDGFVKTYQVGAGSEPLRFGNVPATNHGRGPIIGMPEQNLANGTAAFNYQAAGVLIKVTSATGVATKIRVMEYE